MQYPGAPQMSQTLSSLYPQSRKIQYELKTQLDYLESGRGGSSDDLTNARLNLNQLEQFLVKMDQLVSREPVNKRELWAKKIDQLRDESNFIRHSLEQFLYRTSRKAVEAQERESLLNRRSGVMEANNQAMYLTGESESLSRSAQIIGDLSSLSQNVLGNLGEQHAGLKNAHRKVLDVFQTIGLSSSLLRVIERRDTVDRILVIGGMMVTLGFMYICLAYLRPASSESTP